MSALELRDVVKHYPTRGETVRAVDGVSLTVEPGEFVAIYGPSGSGKTTLLLLAAALMEPDRGSIWFGGRDVTRLAPREAARFRRSDVGFVFQSFHLMPAATALDNAAVKLLASGSTLAVAHHHARMWLERVGLGARFDHTPRELSKGECQRVAIARALANEPRVLLADEPTGNLDSRRSREVLGLLRELSDERGIPVLLVTHDPQAIRIVDRAYTLHDGALADGLDIDTIEPAAP
ncbi:MAG: ABC transporter ATP-binding protein [Conexibacter sp.]